MCEISVAAGRKQARKQGCASRFHRVALGHIQALASRKTTGIAGSAPVAEKTSEFFSM
jgi:hypothetical protein